MFQSRLPRLPRMIPAGAAVGAGALALLATGLAAPASAQSAATISVDWESRTINYIAGAEQINDLYVTTMGPGEEGRRIGFNDVVPIQAGDHCAYEDPEDDTFVVCELPETGDTPDDIKVFLSDGDDKMFTNDPGVTIVHGGDGDDELHAHTAHMVIGDEGDDMMMGHAVLSGEQGMDHMMGTASDEVFYGGMGNDMIDAADGADEVYAYSGDDEVTGGAGPDTISGGVGADNLSGNGGNDTIVGGPGQDTIAGGPGTDDVTQ
jgi:Ca2+-binding RTX toxin-like protein